MPMGFIQSELDLKLLVLYIMSRVAGPVTFLQLLELALCDEGVDYFSLTEAVGHMVETGQLERDEEQHYSITDKGRRNSEICETSLPYSIRLRCDKNLTRCNRALRRKNQVKSATEPRPNGTYTVSLSLDDDMGNIMDLKLMVPREDMGKLLAARFRRAPEKLYSQIIDLLLNAPDSDNEEQSN